MIPKITQINQVKNNVEFKFERNSPFAFGKIIISKVYSI